MQFYRNSLLYTAQILSLGLFLSAVVLISLSQLNFALGLWLLFIVAAGTYCTAQCIQRFSGLTHGNKVLIFLVVLALGWKMFRVQGAIPAPVGGNALISAVNAHVYLMWTWLSPIFSAFLLAIIILSPESQLTATQIRDRRILSQLWWQQRVSRTSKVVLYTTVLLLIFMAALPVFDQVSDHAWSAYLTSNVLIFLPELLLHLLGLLFYAELLAGNSSTLKAAAGSA